MPPVIAGIAATAVLEGVAFEAELITLGALELGIASSVVLGGLQYALTPKPKSNLGSGASVNGSTVTIKQSDSTHKHVYGVTRFTDCYAQAVSTGVNKKLHIVILICADESKSIDEIIVNDVSIAPDDMDADGNVINGKYAGFLRIRTHLGSPNQVADPVMVSEVSGWTSRCRLQGITYAFITMTKSQDVYPTGMPNFSFIGKYRQLYDPRIGDTQWSPNVALFAYDFLSVADYGFEAASTDMNATNISAQANICDEIVDTLDLDTVVTSLDAATDIILLTGTLLPYQICDRVEILTTGVAPGGLATSTDYYVIPYQVNSKPRIRLATSLNNAIIGTYIDITNSGSGTHTIRKTGEPRYHGAGVVDTADILQDSLNGMLSGMAGRACFNGGAWRLLAGAWQSTSLDLFEKDMRSGLGTRSKVAIADRYNTISGLLISPVNNYQRADYPPYRNQSYIDADKGEYPKDYPLNFTSRPTTATRIVKLEVLKSRLEKIFTSSFSMVGMKVQAGDNVALTLSRRGWVSKPFEVTNFGFQVVQAGDNNQQLLTSLTLRETDESIYAWAASTDEPPLVLTPASALPDHSVVEAVTGLSYSSRIVSTTSGDTVYTLVAGWNLNGDGFVINNGMIELQYKLSSDSDYRPSFFVAGSQTFSDLLVSSPNVSYDLRARAVNNLGVRSTWTTLTNCIVGNSGGVGTTTDYGSVADTVGSSLDYGSVADPVGTTYDYGFVA